MDIGNERNKPERGFGKGRIASLLVIAMLVLVGSTLTASALQVPPGSNGIFWFEPDPSSAPYGGETTINVWLNSTAELFGGRYMYETDPDTCGEFVVGSYVANVTVFNQPAILTDEKHKMWIGFLAAGFIIQPPGVYHIGSFRMYCNSTSPCTTTMHWIPDVPDTYITNTTGNWDTEEQDGTFECIGAPKPNLNVTAKSETLTGDQFTVTYTVANIGSANAGASTTSIRVDGVEVATDSVPALVPSGTHTATVGPFDCPCGTIVTVTVCADMDDVVDESDETDNCMTNNCTCDSCPLPDLDVTDKHEEWIDQLAGTYNIVYTVTNIGGVDAVASTTSIAIDGSEVATDSVSLLAPSASHTGTLGPYTVSDDSDTIRVCADMDDVVNESNEANNCEENQLHTTGLTIYVDPPRTNVTPQDQFDINIKVDPAGLVIYGVEYYLTYDTGILRAESQVKGPFLGTTSETIVVVNSIDRGAGIVSYAETRKGDTGVTNESISSVIQFTAIGAAGECTDLDLDGVIIVDTSGGVVSAIIVDGEVCLTNNQPPVAIGCTKHLHNNAQKKFECLAQLCSNSTDPDGDDIVYIRWSFGDGEYGTSEGLGDCPCKFHSYTSWIWEPFGDPNGAYVPFNATLTVTDNGDVQLEDTTYINVNVYLAGDANHDGTVNILDVVLIGRTWGDVCTGTDCCELLWTGNDMADMADLNNDCVINILDVVIVGTMWNHNAYYPV